MWKVLPNGLTVVVQPASSAAVVALQMWVKVGSADELEPERGLAHVHEHMLFMGTGRRGLGEIAAAVEAAGGEINAWTSYDSTVYHLVLGARFFEQGLDILADALLDSSFEEGALASELEVVLDEIRQTRDMPAHVVSEQLFQLAYGQHPYRHPIIGRVETVETFTRALVLDFYRRWYVPENMVLVVVGDVDPAQALRAIEGTFGRAPARSIVRPPRPVEPPPSGMRVSIARDRIAEAHLLLGFPVPGLLHPDVPALNLLAVILGQGDAARLPREVRRRKAVATGVHAYAYTPSDPGLFVVGATTPPEKVDPAFQALLEELFRLQHELVTPAELTRARRILEMEVIYQKETVEGAARKLGFFQAVAGDLGFEQRFHEAVARVTPEQLQEVARRTFARSRLSAALLLPAPAEGTTRAVGGDGAPPGAPPFEAAPGTPEPSGQPVAGRLLPAEERPLQGEETLGTTLAVGGLPARDPGVAALAASYSFPDEGRLVQLAREVERATIRRFQAPPLPPAVQGIHRLTLDSGLTLLIQPDRSVPLVAARVAFLGGLRAETVQTQGIENLVARLLTQGTSTRAGEEIAREFDRLGGGVGGFSGRNTLGLRAEFHADHLAEGLALLADCLLDPVFPAVEVERERELVLEEIRARDDNLGSLAFRAFAGQLFRDHPYRFDLLGEEETVTRLTRQQLQEHYTRRYGLARGVLSVVGDVDPAEVVRLVHGLLGRPGGAGVAPPPRLPWTPPDSRQLVFRYRDRAQAHIVLGFPGATVDSPDRFALDLLHTVLNGQGGRLFRELRDRRGLAYSVGAALTEGVDPGSFALYLAVAPERVDDAVTALLAELRRLQAEGIDPAELRRAQEYLLGSQAISLQRGSERAATLAFNELYQLGCDAHLRYPAAILAVSAEGVRDVARRYLDLERYTLAVVKPQDARDAGIDAVPPGP